MSSRVREIIVEHTKTNRANLGFHVLLIVQNAKPVPWDRPKSVAKIADGIAGKLMKFAPELGKLRELVEEAAEPLDDDRAVVEALDAVQRSIRIAERVRDAATARWESLKEHTSLTQESARSWEADMIALAAAFVLHDLTDRRPVRRGGGVTTYSRMVCALYDEFGIVLTEAQRDEAMRRAIEEFDRC